MSVFDATELSAWEPVARAATSVGLGAPVGIERELDGHDAGVRTHALLSLGAAVFGMLSVGAFAPFVAERAASNVTLDVSRIASYVVAGVGFLAGGTIIKRRRRVRGLTTAASLWSRPLSGWRADSACTSPPSSPPVLRWCCCSSMYPSSD